MAARARGGYAAEGPFMSLKHMSTQILSVEISEQPRFIYVQRKRKSPSIPPFAKGDFSVGVGFPLFDKEGPGEIFLPARLQ